MAAPWDTDEIRSAPTIDAQCSMFVSFLFGPVERCENASTKLVRAACVHEHVGEWTACDRCAIGQTSRPMFCNRCSDSSEPHECTMSASVTDWAPAATS